MPHDEPKTNNAVYLWHIKRACEQLATYLDVVDFEQFCEDQQLKDAVFWKINVIGEAIGNLSSAFREQHDEIPWHKARAIRNRIVHGYDTIDEVIVWETATIYIPSMMRLITPLMPPLPEDKDD
tara:strand:+ start:431 stop:802 length:372 start_codon:yes stop_codon:yes gene_type:complete